MTDNKSNSLPRNTIRNEVPVEKKDAKEKPVKKRKKEVDETDVPVQGKFSQIAGVFILLVTVFLTVAFISYIINWFSDKSDDIFSALSFSTVLNDKTIEAHNIGGRMGAALSTLFIKQGFGIGMFFLITWFYILGIRLTLQHRIFSLGKSFALAIVLMTWLSFTLAFVFRNTALSILGGISGYESSLWIEGLMGKLGVFLIILFVFIILLVLVYNFSMMEFRDKLVRLGKVKKGTEDSTDTENPVSANGNVRNQAVDKYNTVEFAVKSEENDHHEDLFVNKQEINSTNNPVIQPIVNQRHQDFEPVILSNKTKPAVKDIELTVETVNTNVNLPPLTVTDPVKAAENIEEEDEPVISGALTGMHTIESAYDPHLDLGSFKMPGIDLLDEYGSNTIHVDKEELEENKNRIVSTLGNYGIQIDKIKATIGPTVTLYEIIPAPGVRIAKIKNLEDDIALSLSALGIRIIAPIPGKGTIGIEVPNQKPDIVGMKGVIGSEKFIASKFELPFAIGKTISNEEFVLDLAKMPHILMAGATGQGKSVGLNAIIASLLYKKHPSELKFIMIDPKKVELTLFSKIERHYLAKLPDSEEAIITDTRKVVRTLNSLNLEMDSRYDLLKDAQVRNIKEYNAKFIARKLNPENGHKFLPYLVVVIDEFADLILTAGKEVEHPLTRLAQLARAIGIHLVIATQRPSVNIITGTIKANFPARIAFRVISKIDSRTILDMGGADQLIGRGDMLLSQGGDIIRLQCAFIDTHEVERITEFIGSQRGYPTAFALPEYNEEETGDPNMNLDPEERDELFEDAARIIVAAQQGSTSLIQRKLKLGYNRAGRIIDQLEAAGIVGPFEGSKAREVKVANEYALEQFLKDLRSKETPEDF